jgi:hypothetical protein
MKKLTVVVFVLCLSVFSQSGAATPDATNKELGKAEIIPQPAQPAEKAVEGEIDQKNGCFTGSYVTNTTCTPGHKIYFTGADGAVLFAANNCDLRYQVVMGNREGATCIFLPATSFTKSGRKDDK